jgi:hypothetical protein
MSKLPHVISSSECGLHRMHKLVIPVSHKWIINVDAQIGLVEFRHCRRLEVLHSVSRQAEVS